MASRYRGKRKLKSPLFSVTGGGSDADGDSDTSGDSDTGDDSDTGGDPDAGGEDWQAEPQIPKKTAVQNRNTRVARFI
jgi:hypothetical protein